MSLDSDKACAALGVYIFTSCDTADGFFGLEKVAAMKRSFQPQM